MIVSDMYLSRHLYISDWTSSLLVSEFIEQIGFKCKFKVTNVLQNGRARIFIMQSLRLNNFFRSEEKIPFKACQFTGELIPLCKWST